MVSKRSSCGANVLACQSPESPLTISRVHDALALHGGLRAAVQQLLHQIAGDTRVGVHAQAGERAAYKALG